jgi:hypothetical protein
VPRVPRGQPDAGAAGRRASGEGRGLRGRRRRGSLDRLLVRRRAHVNMWCAHAWRRVRCAYERAQRVHTLKCLNPVWVRAHSFRVPRRPPLSACPAPGAPPPLHTRPPQVIGPRHAFAEARQLEGRVAGPDGRWDLAALSTGDDVSYVEALGGSINEYEGFRTAFEARRPPGRQQARLEHERRLLGTANPRLAPTIYDPTSPQCTPHATCPTPQQQYTSKMSADAALEFQQARRRERPTLPGAPRPARGGPPARRRSAVRHNPLARHWHAPRPPAQITRPAARPRRPASALSPPTGTEEAWHMGGPLTPPLCRPSAGPRPARPPPARLPSAGGGRGEVATSRAPASWRGLLRLRTGASPLAAAVYHTPACGPGGEAPGRVPSIIFRLWRAAPRARARAPGCRPAQELLRRSSLCAARPRPRPCGAGGRRRRLPRCFRASCPRAPACPGLPAWPTPARGGLSLGWALSGGGAWASLCPWGGPAVEARPWLDVGWRGSAAHGRRAGAADPAGHPARVEARSAPLQQPAGGVAPC